MSYFEHTKKDVDEAYEEGRKQGRKETLCEVLADVYAHEKKMLERGWVNMYAGARRVDELLKDKLNQELVLPKGHGASS